MSCAHYGCLAHGHENAYLKQKIKFLHGKSPDLYISFRYETFFLTCSRIHNIRILLYIHRSRYITINPIKHHLITTSHLQTRICNMDTQHVTQQYINPLSQIFD